MNAFKILGIEPTQDTKVIKKTYAALVKKYHPEENIQKWQEIHEAYQNALSWAEGRNYLTKTATASKQPQEADFETDAVQTSEIVSKQPRKEKLEQSSLQQADESVEETAELNKMFDNLEELSATSKAEKSEQEKEELRRAIVELERIGRPRKLKLERFKELFFREEYQQAIRHNDFLYSWSKLLERKTVNKKLYQLMKEQLESIVQYQFIHEEPVEKTGLIEPTRLVGMRIDAAYDRYKVKRRQLSWIAVFGTLILLEVIPFTIYRVNEWTKQRLKWEQESQETQKLQDSTEKQLRDDLPRAMFFSEINLETLTEADIYVAGASWNGLAKFLMRADEEILSIVLPYTQTLEPGVLVLGEEFEIEKALQGERKEEEISGSGNIYEMVHFSLPYSNQLRIGEERIDLPKGTVRFAIRTEGDADSILLWIDPKEMGFEEGCEIYYFDGEEYQKVGEILSEADVLAQRRYYNVLTYRVFEVQVSRLEEDEFPVVIIPTK